MAKKNDHKSVEVTKLPPCDIFHGHGDAHYDGKTTQGPWGYMCEACFKRYGVGLGLGKGQKLVLVPIA